MDINNDEMPVLFLILLITLLLLIPCFLCEGREETVSPSAGYRRHHCREGRFPKRLPPAMRPAPWESKGFT